MTTFSARTLSDAATQIDRRAIDELARDLSRPLVLPDSPDYDEARRVFNKMIDKRPALIVRCGGVPDVLCAVRFARAHELLVAVRGGAHNAAGFATCDGGIVIDLSPMRGIRIDVESRLVRAEGGATWGDVDRETQAFGLVAVGGIVSTTGVAGLTLGGGQGWFRRTFGMTCDNLVSADVVTADGRLLSVSETAHSDLFWALKGGGGNFGIVTSFEFRLHQVGPMVAFAGPVYPVEKARTILGRFRDFALDAPDEVNVNAVLWSIPGGSTFPQHLHGREVLIISGTYAGAPERGHEFLRPLREFDEPILDMSATIPYCALQQLFDPFFARASSFTIGRRFTSIASPTTSLKQVWAAAPRGPLKGLCLQSRRWAAPWAESARRRRRSEAGPRPSSSKSSGVGPNRRTPSRTWSGCVTSSKRCTGSRRARQT